MPEAQAIAPDDEGTSTESFANRPAASVRVGAVTASVWRKRDLLVLFRNVQALIQRR